MAKGGSQKRIEGHYLICGNWPEVWQREDLKRELKPIPRVYSCSWPPCFCEDLKGELKAQGTALPYSLLPQPEDLKGELKEVL